MCGICCKEFKGWCKSFTTTEAVLSALEGVLLVIFIGFLSFLILHLTVCKDSVDISVPSEVTVYESVRPGSELDRPEQPDIRPLPKTKPRKTAQGKDCTWTPSMKTQATTRYFEMTSTESNNVSSVIFENTEQTNTIYPSDHFAEITTTVEDSDGDDPEPMYENVVVALVKTRPRHGLVLGCTLTVVSEYWTLTAASCIESIEEVDSLDSFVIMESYRELANGATHAVGDVQINPFYQGTNKSYDLAALKSEGSLVKRSGVPVVLPVLLDYLLIAVGERFTILGYGKFRTVTDKVLGRRLRAVHVHEVPSVQCAADDGKWAPRHLWGGAPAEAAAPAAAGCGAAPLCAGPLHARSAPCNYCAGTPLLAGRLLLGVMSGNAQCGVACEPALYVNIAAVRDWLDIVIDSD